jgi:hypothetical protein
MAIEKLASGERKGLFEAGELFAETAKRQQDLRRLDMALMTAAGQASISGGGIPWKSGQSDM